MAIWLGWSKICSNNKAAVWKFKLHRVITLLAEFSRFALSREKTGSGKIFSVLCHPNTLNSRKIAIYGAHSSPFCIADLKDESSS